MEQELNPRSVLQDFLTTRRARITPAEAGLPENGTARRRVKGLRREEVALLAGISPEYYVRLERGRAAGVSAGIVDAVAATLRLDDTERAHLRRLLLALEPGHRAEQPVARTAVRPGVRRLVEGFTDLPAYVFTSRLDILTANDLGRALYSPLYEVASGSPNSARFTFLHEDRAREFWPEWDTFADHAVAELRAATGRHPGDRELAELIAVLSERSEQFRARWATHDVIRQTVGTKVVNHPATGVLTLPFEVLVLSADPDLHLMVYTPGRGSPEHDALGRLSGVRVAG